MFFNVKLPWNHLASILLTPDNRMMYSLYQYALGKDNIEIEVNSFLFWLIPLWAVSFWDSYAKILEGWYRRKHIHSTMQIHTCRPGDAHSTSPRSGAKIGIPFFFFLISGTLSFFGEIYPVSVCRAEPEDWCQSTEALRWYDTRNHLVTGNRDTERRLPETGASVPVACWDTGSTETCTYAYNFHFTWINSHMVLYSMLRHVWHALSQTDKTHDTDRCIYKGGTTNLIGESTSSILYEINIACNKKKKYLVPGTMT